MQPYPRPLGWDAEQTRPTHFQEEVVQGYRTGINTLNKFAFRNQIQQLDGEVIIIPDTLTLANFEAGIITTADTLTIAYNNVTDGQGQTGALELTFFHIGADGNEAENTHVLGNTGSDVTTFTTLGVNRVAVSLNGGARANVNDIEITATAGGATQAFIPAGSSVTQQAISHVPLNGDGGVLQYIWLNGNRSTGFLDAQIRFRGYIYNRGVDTRFDVFRYEMDCAVKNVEEYVDPTLFPLNPGDVFYKFGLNLYNNRISEGE